MSDTGIWDTLSGLILDTTGHIVEADGSLEQFDTVDQEMDRYQDRGYLLVATIATESEDPRAQELARKALQQFYLAERLEAQNEGNVHQGHAAVKEAKETNGQAVGLSQHQRHGTGRP